MSLILSGLFHFKAGSTGLGQFSVRNADVWNKASQIDHTASDKDSIQSSPLPHHLVHQDQKASLGNRARHGSAPTHFPPPAPVCNLGSSRVTSGKSSEGQMGSDSAQKSCRCRTQDCRWLCSGWVLHKAVRQTGLGLRLVCRLLVQQQHHETWASQSGKAKMCLVLRKASGRTQVASFGEEEENA